MLAWCVPSLELCLKSVNSKDNGAQSCFAPLQYSNWRVSIVFSTLHKGFLHSCHLQSRRMSHIFLYKLHRLPNVWKNHAILIQNMMLRSTDHVCKCKKHDVAWHRPCVQVQKTWCCVAPTMCASARNMLLRSTNHVCKCKECYHPHPTPPQPHPTPWCCVAPTMCASARNMMLRSTNHVCKCKECYHPHPTPWCSVAPTMCASARNMMLRNTNHVCKCKECYHPHPTPPQPHPMVLRSTDHVCKCKKHDVAHRQPCVQVQRTLSSPPHPTPPPTSCVASTMSTPGEPPVPRVIWYMLGPAKHWKTSGSSMNQVNRNPFVNINRFATYDYRV